MATRRAESGPGAARRVPGRRFYTEDLRRRLAALGCAVVRTAAPIGIDDPEVEARMGFAAFTSRTIRAFKLELGGPV
jgi:hypothetical protein